MRGRFFDETEKKYMSLFKEQRILDFYLSAKKEAYLSLLQASIKRGTPVTKEEIISLIGSKERYMHNLEILKGQEA